jgi:hypothetical protein
MPRRQRIKHQPAESPELLRLIRAIISDDASEVANLLANLPSLAKQPLAVGTAREGAQGFYFQEIEHYLYVGDTPLYVAAAGYRGQIARKLLRNVADVAANGSPGSAAWNPKAQGEMIALLIGVGADPNALDKSGIAPLHRAGRERCTAAVDSLLGNGASLRLKKKSGSRPFRLAVQRPMRNGFCRIQGSTKRNHRTVPQSRCEPKGLGWARQDV